MKVRSFIILLIFNKSTSGLFASVLDIFTKKIRIYANILYETIT